MNSYLQSSPRTTVLIGYISLFVVEERLPDTSFLTFIHSLVWLFNLVSGDYISQPLGHVAQYIGQYINVNKINLNASLTALTQCCQAQY